MTVQFRLVPEAGTDPHLFAIVTPDSEAELLDAVVHEYVELRSATALAMDSVSVEGITVFDADKLKERIRRASIPGRKGGKFDVVRSDFGECLGYLALEKLFNTTVCHKSVRFRERKDMAARGIDIIGIEDGHTLILGEAKVSDQDSSPPDVVDKNIDSLSKRLKQHVSGRAETSARLWEAARQSLDSGVRDRLFAIAVLWDEARSGLLTVICCAFLVRPKDLYRPTDFGRLRTDPRYVGDAQVRFLIAPMSERIEALIDHWSERVRAAG
jgi:hypothetical protein